MYTHTPVLGQHNFLVVCIHILPIVYLNNRRDIFRMSEAETRNGERENNRNLCLSTMSSRSTKDVLLNFDLSLSEIDEIGQL